MSLPPRDPDLRRRPAAAGRTLALLQAISAQSSGLRNIFKASFPRLFAN
jgi:hypothetical protein